jgi:hypothetical protein
MRNILFQATKEVAMLTKIVSRSTVLAAIVALALASISATSVFAAGRSHNPSMDHNLKSDWKTELAVLKTAQFTDKSIGKWDTEWLETKRTSNQMHQENRYAVLAAVDLRRAEIIAGKHLGFASNGKVINRAQANQTLQTLAQDLHRFHMEVTDKIRALFSS